MCKRMLFGICYPVAALFFVIISRNPGNVKYDALEKDPHRENLK